MLFASTAARKPVCFCFCFFCKILNFAISDESAKSRSTPRFANPKAAEIDLLCFALLRLFFASTASLFVPIRELLFVRIMSVPSAESAQSTESASSDLVDMRCQPYTQRELLIIHQIAQQSGPSFCVKDAVEKAQRLLRDQLHILRTDKALTSAFQQWKKGVFYQRLNAESTGATGTDALQDYELKMEEKTMTTRASVSQAIERVMLNERGQELAKKQRELNDKMKALTEDIERFNANEELKRMIQIYDNRIKLFAIKHEDFFVKMKTQSEALNNRCMTELEQLMRATFQHMDRIKDKLSEFKKEASATALLESNFQKTVKYDECERSNRLRTAPDNSDTGLRAEHRPPRLAIKDEHGKRSADTDRYRYHRDERRRSPIRNHRARVNRYDEDDNDDVSVQRRSDRTPITSIGTYPKALRYMVQKMVTDSGHRAVTEFNTEFVVFRIMQLLAIEANHYAHPAIPTAVSFERYNRVIGRVTNDFLDAQRSSDTEAFPKQLERFLLQCQGDRTMQLVLWVVALKQRFEKRFLQQCKWALGERADAAIKEHMMTLLDFATRTRNVEFIKVVLSPYHPAEWLHSLLLNTDMPDDERVSLMTQWMENDARIECRGPNGRQAVQFITVANNLQPEPVSREQQDRKPIIRMLH